ncbi:MAG TPA: hypothetical protein VM098_08030 [Phycisphaerae bacterium]|nr:hypothetical protein [Phycisphaerae bacterium]
MPGEYQVGCYYFPNYHVDRRNELVHGPGWSEGTEGSLEPDTEHGTGYLEAVRDVFGTGRGGRPDGRAER